jgi:TonB family protein
MPFRPQKFYIHTFCMLTYTLAARIKNFYMKFLLFCTVTLFVLNAPAQWTKPLLIEYFDAQWQPVSEPAKVNKPKKAAYMRVFMKRSDTCWTVCDYHYSGSLLRKESFLDSLRTKRHGVFAWYNENGYVDSIMFYNQGVSTRRIVRPSGGAGLKPPPMPTDSFPGRIDKAAAFKQGSFKEHLDYYVFTPPRAMELKINGTVIVSFIVNTDGTVTNVHLEKSLEYSVDEMAIRMIHKTNGKWNPGYQNGQPVKSLHFVPINMITE